MSNASDKRFNSWKDIVEFYLKELERDYPEDLYSDPAESELCDESGSVTLL